MYRGRTGTQHSFLDIAHNCVLGLQLPIIIIIIIITIITIIIIIIIISAI
jgi:hypothetical protein